MRLDLNQSMPWRRSKIDAYTVLASLILCVWAGRTMSRMSFAV